MVDMPVAPSSPEAVRQVVERVLERITYANEDTGYTIARLATEHSGPDLLTVVGPLLGARSVRACG
jgi:exodeoxyribonuclease V alpha subunit